MLTLLERNAREVGFSDNLGEDRVREDRQLHDALPIWGRSDCSALSFFPGSFPGQTGR